MKFHVFYVQTKKKPFFHYWRRLNFFFKNIFSSHIFMVLIVMAFGKRKRKEPEQFESEIQEIEENSSDEGVEEINLTSTQSQYTKADTSSSDILQPDNKLKPLISEVTYKGVAQGKNVGGAKIWLCNHCIGIAMKIWRKL
ncbi:hypothetical protein ACH5RR_015889 [Cinchona calisaya]|uniref:Uncharacterized protein n=1 Tax=Cinchona calisaya TaxID=153742 RepID=A0ABD2ZUC4_9GENT